MTFVVGVIAVVAALAIPPIVRLAVAKLPPGRLGYAGVRLWLSAFIVVTAVSGWFALGILSDVLGLFALPLYLFTLVAVVMACRHYVQLHLEFTAVFRARDLPMRQAMWQVVDWMERYAGLYNEVQVGRCLDTSSDKEVHPVRGGKLLATIALVDGDADALFREIGVRTLGLYDWPKGDVTAVSLTYLGDDRWELNDGSGPVSSRPKSAQA